MQGVPVKFRGKDWDTDKYVYGDLVLGDDGFVFINNKNIYRVYPESVAQLVGYDADGTEVYEGDKIWDKYGNVAIVIVNTNYDLPSFYLYPKENDND